MTRGQSETDKRCCMIEAEHLPSASKTKQKKTNNKELEEKTNYALFASKQKQTDKREMRRRKIMMLHSTDNTFFLFASFKKMLLKSFWTLLLFSWDGHRMEVGVRGFYCSNLIL